MIGTNRSFSFSFSDTIANELHNWIDKHHNIIQYTNVSDSTCFKVNTTILKKKNQLIRISVQELYNDIILPVSQGIFGCKKCGWKSMYWRYVS